MKLTDYCPMGTAIAPLIISSAATLAGVSIAGILAEYRERRRTAVDERRAERQNRQDHYKWLRQERRLLYSATVLNLEKAADQYSRLLDDLLADSYTRTNDPTREQRALMEDLTVVSREVARQVIEIQLVGSDLAAAAAKSGSDCLDAVTSLLRHMGEATVSVEADAFIRTSQVWNDLRRSLQKMIDAVRVDIGSPSEPLGP
ncbi:hypothetical protein I6A60_35405 [Frankia sp. AgB1.9]|uniref:hypothetical protein n=1 Tax=unclassified Frankia TaxID=2632575 RepID=UPI0019317B5A|nr:MULTISPECIES: hypothetical protein [unclassified Frankia]MBL7489317.1 hypothetical protein [Frankia sp. AgW1.1]MBL7553099.1 hypothetical protein [Frankia sp. AgB1.9]MBL7623084.1 hypothetical protein [Frankia sp. AgB1.8]